MKRIISLVLCLTLVFALSATAFAFNITEDGSIPMKAKENVNYRSGPGTNYDSYGILNTGEVFYATDDTYTLEEYNAALNSETQVVMDSLVLQGEVYFVVTSTPIPEGYMLQQNGKTIYTSNNLFYAATASREGIWVLENNYFDGKSNYSLCLISSDGNVKKTIDLTSIYTGETYERLLVFADDNLYLVSEGTELVVISSSGKLNCEIDLPDEMSYPVSGSDGRAFLVQPTLNGNQIYLVDIDT